MEVCAHVVVRHLAARSDRYIKARLDIQTMAWFAITSAWPLMQVPDIRWICVRFGTKYMSEGA